MLASIYRLNRNNDKVIELLDRAEDISKDFDDFKYLSEIYNEKGFMYFEIGDREKSLEFYKKALELAERLDEKKLIAMIRGNIGLVYIENDKKRSKDYFNDMLSISKDIADKRTEILALNNLGVLSANTGDFKIHKSFFIINFT